MNVYPVYNYVRVLIVFMVRYIAAERLPKSSIEDGDSCYGSRILD